MGPPAAQDRVRRSLAYVTWRGITSPILRGLPDTTHRTTEVSSEPLKRSEARAGNKQRAAERGYVPAEAWAEREQPGTSQTGASALPIARKSEPEKYTPSKLPNVKEGFSSHRESEPDELSRTVQGEAARHTQRPGLSGRGASQVPDSFRHDVVRRVASVDG